MQARYTVDVDQIVAEALEGEVMVVNLANGYYYVIEGTGADLWPLLAGGSTVSEAASAMAQRYRASTLEIETAVSEFVAQLVAEDLLNAAAVEEEPDARDVTIEDVAAADDSVGTLAPFTLPAMYKYTDMANLVQMDPIRDFEESRWPRRKKAVQPPRP